MRILGREYGLRYTVGAQGEIANLKNEPNPQQTSVAARIPIILSEWNEKAEARLAREEGREYDAHPLTWETVAMLTVKELNEVMAECDRVINRDCGRTVEVDAAEKKTDPPTGG